MPPAITPKLAEQASRIFKLRDVHRSCGGLLAAWDTASLEYGLCAGEISQATVRPGDDSLICCVEGPPATVYTLTVTRLSPLSGQRATSGPPPVVRFELLGGAGRGSSLIMTVDWSPNDWLVGAEQSYIFQSTARLCSSWWLFARTTFGQDAGFECSIDVRLLLERATPTRLTPPELGPDVVLVP